MKTKNIIFLIAILVLIGIITVAFELQKKRTEQNMENEQVQNHTANIQQEEVTTTTQEIANGIDTSNWKTYKNEEFGFEVKYPGDFDVLQEVNIDNELKIYFGIKSKYGIGYGYDGDFFISVYNATDKNIDGLIKDIGNQFSDRQENKENVIVDTLPAIKAIITTQSVMDWYYEAVAIENQGKIYFISNGAKKINAFEEFYNSFKVLK